MRICLNPGYSFLKRPPACPGSAHTSCLSSWTPAQHYVTDGSYSKCMWQATRDSIFGSWQCLVLVAWPRILLLRVARIGEKQYTIYRYFCPHFLKSNVQTFWIFGILGKKCWKEVVSDLKIFTHKGCKIALAKKKKKKKITILFLICLICLNIFLPSLPKVQCPNFLIFGILEEK